MQLKCLIVYREPLLFECMSSQKPITIEVNGFDFVNGLGFGALMEFWYKVEVLVKLSSSSGLQTTRAFKVDDNKRRRSCALWVY